MNALCQNVGNNTGVLQTANMSGDEHINNILQRYINQNNRNRSQSITKAPTKKPTKKGRKAKQSQKENEPTNRYAPFLNLVRENELRLRARQLTNPGKGVVDISGDDLDGLYGIDKPDDPKAREDNKLCHLNLYLNTGKHLCFYVSGLLMTEDMLDFSNVRRWLIAFEELTIRFGVKVDKGQESLSGGPYDEPVTVGLDELPDACAKYKQLGVIFTYWKCVFKLSEHTPTMRAITDNCNAIAQFANISQNAGLVPIASVEFTVGGVYEIQASRDIFETILDNLVKSLNNHHVYMEGLIIQFKALPPKKLKPQKFGLAGAPLQLEEMTGLRDPRQSVAEQRAAETYRAMYRTLPPALGGVMVANDDTLESSIAVLNELNQCTAKRMYPISYCFGDVIQNEAITKWAGLDRNLDTSGELIVKRAKMCSLASMGQLSKPERCILISNVSMF